ncbi:MAG: hypothetical protein AB1626_03650 [Candidatus Micrarchaeota archaeon]
MAYPPYAQPVSKRESAQETLIKIIVFVALVLVLLVVLTKFKFIHPRDIPGWKGLYCGVIEQRQSRIMILHGDEGLGDPEKLANQLSRFRISAPPEQLHASRLSSGMLKNYELVIVDRMKRITFTQAEALKSYMDGGGSIVWIGDAGSDYYLSEEDRQAALLENETNPGAYERLLNKSERTTGFGDIGRDYLGVTYLRTENATSGVVLKVVDRSNVLVQAVVQELEVGSMSFAVVNENKGGAAFISKSAVLDYGGHEYPAVIDSKYVGRIVYIAFPPEQITESAYPTGLLTNMVDYLVSC